MKPLAGFQPWVKGLLFWVVFMLMYALQKLVPVFPVNLFTAVNESTFQHMKATFFAYLFISLIEYFIFRKHITNPKSWGYARLTAVIIAPWVMFLTWYLMAATYGRLPNNFYEILWGNIATLAVGFLAATLERGWEQVDYSRPMAATLLSLFAFSILLYITLTFKLPWADVFMEADWKESTFLQWRIYV